MGHVIISPLMVIEFSALHPHNPVSEKKKRKKLQIKIQRGFKTNPNEEEENNEREKIKKEYLLDPVDGGFV